MLGGMDVAAGLRFGENGPFWGRFREMVGDSR